MVSINVDLSSIVDGQNANAVDVTTPFYNLKQAVEDLLNGIQVFDMINFGTAQTATIASGVISATKTHIVVDTQGAAASDDLDTISGGAQGRILFLRTASSARTVVLKHATGNIRMANGNDYAINNTDKFAVLIHNGTYWVAAIVAEAEFLNIGTDTTLTISSGIVTRTRTRHLIGTESSLATDDLDRVNGGTEGDLLVLTAAALNGMVRVRSGAVGGNIKLADPTGFRWLDTKTALILTYDGTDWIEHKAPPSLPVVGLGNYWSERAAAATLEAIGIAAGTNGGAGAVANANDDTDTYTIQTIAASAGTVGGRKTTTFNLVRRAYNPTFEAVIKTGTDITNVRYWIGLCSAAPGNVDSLGAIYGCFFRYSTVVPDGGWVAINSDGSAQSSPVQVSSIAANTRYVMRIRIDTVSGIAYFSIDNGPEYQISANTPGASQDMGACVLAITTTASANKGFGISRYGVRW